MKTLNFQNFCKGTKKSTLFFTAAAVAVTLSITSCNKDKDPGAGLSLQNELAPIPDEFDTENIGNGAEGTISDYRGDGIYSVENYFVDQGIFDHPDSIYHRPNGSYYFDLSHGDNKVGTPPAGYDLEFTGTGNAYIKTATGVTLKVLDGTPLSSVTIADTTAATVTIGGGGFGHDNTIFSGPPDYTDGNSPGDKKGWFNYYFPTHQVHPIADRILIIKDAANKYYALQFISVYQNATPAGTPYANNYSYLHFDYKKLN